MTSPLVHLVRRPQNSKGRPPILILLHGVGSHEGDLFSLESAFDPSWIVVSARAPLTLRPGSYGWFPVQFSPQGPVADAIEAEKSRTLLGQFVDWAVQEYQADPQRVVVGGFSQGAIMAASLGLTEPEKMTAAVLMSGRILPEVLPKVVPLERRVRPQYLVVHGTEDQVLPLHHGRASRDTLLSLGIRPHFLEFTMGHTITEESLAAVKDWLKANIAP